VSLEEWRGSWSAFLRPDDVCVTWGMFYAALATKDRIALGESCLDLRGATAQLHRRRFETVEDALAASPEADGGDTLTGPGPAPTLGRAGSRLETLVRLVEALAARATSTLRM